MISRTTLQFVDCLILTSSGISGLLALFGAVYIVPWKRRTGDNSATRDYNTLWIVRLLLQLTAAAWLFCPFLNTYTKWSSHFDDSSQANLRVICWSYVMIRSGVLEPFFLFLSLLTFSECLLTPQEGYLLPVWWFQKPVSAEDDDGVNTVHKNRRGRRRREKQRNGRIIYIAALWTVAVLLLQSLAPVLDALGVVHGDEPNGSVLLDSLRDSLCWSSGECEVCVIPLLSTLFSALIVARYIWLIWLLTLKMAELAMNQCLAQRMHFFRSLVTVLLLSSLFFRGIGIVWSPGHVLHEFCRLAEFLSVLIFVSTFSFLLVIRPVREGRIADKNVNQTSNLVGHL